MIHQFKVRDSKTIKNLWRANRDIICSKRTPTLSKSINTQSALDVRDLATIPRSQERRKFASFFFRWSSDENIRLIFYIMPDVKERNVQRFGSSVIHYWRWVEVGFLVELLRLTDFMNSLKPHKRQRLSALGSLSWIKPSEELIHDLWEVAKNRMAMAQFLRMWTQGGD